MFETFLIDLKSNRIGQNFAGLFNIFPEISDFDKRVIWQRFHHHIVFGIPFEGGGDD